MGSGGVEYAFEYDYDGAHNRTVKVVDGVPTYYTYNAANELLTETTGGETTYYHYDGRGNTVAKQEAAGTTYYAYNTENLMTRMDFAGGGSSYYDYDADSKRVSQRTVDGFRQFVYQGPDMLKLQLERDESEETVAHYTMGAGLEAMRRETSSFYHYNHLGTTLALTGADEAVSDTYRHDAWGVLLASTGSTVNPHTYVGRERYYRMGLAAGTHFVTVTRDHEQVPHTVSDFAEDLVVCDVPESVNTDAASFVSGLEADYSDLRVFASDGITPVAFGVKEFSQTSGSEVLRIAVHSDSISTTADESWVIARGCTPHPTNATWEDRASVVAEDCEGYWPMGGTEDWTANENDGTNTNGTVADGQVANATSFSGNGWYDCGTDSSLRISGDLTVVAWVRPNSGGSGHICAKGTGGDYTHMYEFRWDPDGRLRLIGGNEAGDGYGFRPYTAADVVVDETWNCCAAVIDGSGIRMYVDGVEKYNSSGAVTSRQVNDDTFYIGRRGDGWMNASGRIDEMQVYSGARSADWIEVYYAMTSAPGAWASVTSEQAVTDASLYHLGFRDYAQGVGRFTTVDPAGVGAAASTDLRQAALRELNRITSRTVQIRLSTVPAMRALLGSLYIGQGAATQYAYGLNRAPSATDALGLQPVEPAPVLPKPPDQESCWRECAPWGLLGWLPYAICVARCRSAQKRRKRDWLDTVIEVLIYELKTCSTYLVPGPIGEVMAILEEMPTPVLLPFCLKIEDLWTQYCLDDPQPLRCAQLEEIIDGPCAHMDKYQ